MPTFREWVTQTLAPIWLRGVWATKFLGVAGDAADRLAMAAKDAVKVAHPATCPDDALSYNGAARNVDRYFADDNDTYRTRISDPWSLWPYSGSKTALVSRLNEQSYSDVQIFGWYELEPSVPAKWADWYSAFFVWINPPHNITRDDNWDDPGTWGDEVGATIVGAPSGPGVWDCNMTSYEVHELKASIWKWKEAHEICADIAILVSGDRWEDETPWDNGVWSDDTSFVHIPGYL